MADTPLSGTEPYFKSDQGLPIAKKAAKNGKDGGGYTGVELDGAYSRAVAAFTGNTGASAAPDPNVAKAAQKHVPLQCRPSGLRQPSRRFQLEVTIVDKRDLEDSEHKNPEYRVRSCSAQGA